MSHTTLDEDTFFTVTRDHLLPRLAQHHEDPAKPVRIWSIGCQAGDEALLLLLCAVQAQGNAVSPTPLRFAIFATDPSAEAVQEARKLASSDRLQERASLAPYQHLLKASQNGLALSQTLRESLIFGQHDLLTQPAFARLELIVCALPLTDYTTTQQRELWQRWAYGLLPHGLALFLAPLAVAPDAQLYHELEAAVPAPFYARTTVPAIQAHSRTTFVARALGLTSKKAKKAPASTPTSPEEENAKLLEELQAGLEEQLVYIQELEETAQLAQRAEAAE